MARNLGYYSEKFKKLRVDRSKGVAPHKPILLLSVIKLIRQEKIQQNQISLSPELIATFLELWSRLAPDRQPDIGLPFFHLRGDKFWHHQPKLGFESVIKSGARVRTVNLLQEVVQYACFDRELFELLQNPVSRDELTYTLLETFFSDRVRGINQLFQIDAFQDWQEQLKSQGGKVYEPDELTNEETTIVRDAAFRRVIVSIYDYRCALCGLKILNSLGQNIVDGAHIKPFYQFRDDRINNGLSLCKNHHWAFDHFWFTINSDYTILVADDLWEVSPNSTSLKKFEGQLILRPANAQYHPSLDALEWHHQEFLQRVA